jgi:outer membrane immunogenic protein
MKSVIFALALLTAPAVAQEFVGPRVEGVIGWDEQRYDNEFVVGGAGRNPSLGYGFAVGYDAAIGNGLIAGVEGGMLFSDRTLRFGTADDGGLVRPRRDLELSGRLGITIADRAMLYGKIGYSNFQIREGLLDGGTETSRKSSLDGVRLGAGIEVPINLTTYLKTEYRYSNYERGVQKNDVLTGFGIRF